MKRISQTHVSFAAIAGAICDKLEQRKTQIYLAMAKEGRELELTFQRWSVDPPENDERVKALTALSDWQRASLDLLTER